MPGARDVAHRILGVICRAGGHSATCDRVTAEIVADRAARAADEPTAMRPPPAIVYIAGRFRAPDHWQVLENIRAAERVGFEVAQAGAMPLIPHANTASFAGTLTDAFWLSGTMELMRRCDAVLMVPGWSSSSGAVGEREEALRLGLPVFDGVPSLRAWLESRP